MQTNSTFPLKIEQSLHGYDRGHRMLQCSIELDESSRAQMLILSDLLSTSELRQGASYLTAYPLKGAQRFVLARTWAAGANFRPGSVWTHSLIIDYPTLATVHDVAILATLFRYPEEDRLQEFSEPLIVSIPEGVGLDLEGDPRAPEALAMLYASKPVRDIVVPSTDLESNEILALQLWRQMWPGMRRDFAFMTITGEWPGGIEFACSLRYSKNVGLEPPPLQVEWPIGFNLLLGDLPKNGPTELRTFLARYVIENKFPRAAAMPVAMLFALKKDAPFEIRLQAYRDLILTLHAPRLSREFIADEIERIDSAGDLITLVRMLKGTACDADVQEPLTKLRGFSSQELRALLDASSQSKQDELGGKVFKSLVQIASLQALAMAVDEHTRLEVAFARPEISNEISFWPRLDADKVEIFNQLSRIRRFDVDWGWKVFERSLSSDILARLLVHSESCGDGIVQILLNGKEEQRRVIVNWLFENEQRFADLTKKIGSPNIDLLSTLASAQMRSLRRLAQADWWANKLLDIDLKCTALDCPSSLLALGIICGLKTQIQSSWQLTSKYFTLAVRAATSFHFSSNEENFLLSELSGSASYLPTRRRLISAALDRWPISQASPGALGLTQDRDIIDSMLTEADLRGQRNILVGLSNSSQLPSGTRERIEMFLAEKKKVWLFPWSWL